MEGDGGGLQVEICSDASVTVYNNIVFSNTAVGAGDDISLAEESSCEDSPNNAPNVFNNDYIDIVATITANIDATTNLINVDPAWENPAGDDFHLTAASLVIDKGDLNPPGGLPTPDFDGVTRPQGPLPDMGALEFQAIPTPSPTPTPIPTPTPPATGLLLFGGGCNLGSGAESTYFLRFLLLLPLIYGARRYFRSR